MLAWTALKKSSQDGKAIAIDLRIEEILQSPTSLMGAVCLHPMGSGFSTKQQDSMSEC